MKKIREILIICFGLLQANPVITEIFFVAETGTTVPQYIELYNNSSEPVEISSWGLALFDSSGTQIGDRPWLFSMSSNYIQINNYVDDNPQDGAYSTGEKIWIEPYSYFIISSSFCLETINDCDLSSEFYTNSGVNYDQKSDIIIKYLYYPHSKGKIILLDNTDTVIDSVRYNYEIGWPVNKETIKGRSLRLHSNAIDVLLNDSYSNWSVSPDTDISPWLYNGVIEAQNFGSPKEENSFPLNNIIYSETSEAILDTHLVFGDVNKFYSYNNYSIPLQFSWYGSGIENSPNGYSLNSINYKILIKKNGALIINDSLNTNSISLDILPYTLNIDSRGDGREIADYDWTVELTKTYQVAGEIIEDIIYSDVYTFSIDASTFGRYGCVDNGNCTDDITLINGDNNLELCPTSEFSSKLFKSSYPFGCEPGSNTGNDCFQAINYYEDANINSGTCHYVSLSAPEFLLGDKSTKVELPIYLYNDSLAQIKSISYSLNLEDFSSFSIDFSSDESCSGAISNPPHLDDYFIDKSCYKNGNEIKINLNLNIDNNYDNLQGVINFVEFNLPNSNLSSNYQLDNILITSNTLYNNIVPSLSKSGEIVALDDSYEISGNVLYYSGDTPYEIPGVELILNKLYDGSNVLSTINTVTNAYGYYNFELLEKGHYYLSFQKDFTDECNGDYISGIDISRIAKYVNGNSSFNFDQLIAADISLDGTVSSFDVSLLAQYNVGLINNFNNKNLHWIFRPTIDSTLNDLYATLIESSGQYSIQYDPLLLNDRNRKISGYRLGDVSGNYCKDNTARSSIDYTFSEQKINYQPIITIPIRLLEKSLVEGLDIQIQYDKDIFEPISFNFINIDTESYDYISNIITNDQEISAVLWSINDPKLIYGNIGEIKFKWKDKSEGGKIGVNNFIVNDNIAKGGIGLDFDDLEESFDGLHINNNNPTKLYLDQNYPNPFNPETAILWSMPESGNISIDIYNIHGHHIESIFSGYKDAGNHEYFWNASLHASGVYFYRLKMDNLIFQKKMILLK